jgi:hypothetical protein
VADKILTATSKKSVKTNDWSKKVAGGSSFKVIRVREHIYPPNRHIRTRTHMYICFKHLPPDTKNARNQIAQGFKQVADAFLSDTYLPPRSKKYEAKGYWAWVYVVFQHNGT